MSNCVRSPRKARRERILRKMASMRAAKARRRLEKRAGREPELIPFYPLQFAVRDRRNGDTSQWIDIRSGRDVARRIGMLLRFYK